MPADADGRLLRLGLTMETDLETSARKDLSASAKSFIAIWVAPIAVASLLSLAALPAWIALAAWTIAFTWTGLACLINARRCGRVHCFVSGPILLIGAGLIGALAFNALDPDKYSLALIVGATLALAALTYGLERFWGRYRRST
jgi:hypothetical protein